MEGDNSRDPTEVPNQNPPSRQDLAQQKSILDEISRNTKELETFLNSNQKMRSCLLELVQSYLVSNDERMRTSYGALKDNLRYIESNCNNFQNLVRRVPSTHSPATKDEFNSVFHEKNNEINESLMKMEFNYKYNFTISIFKPILELQSDEILREILKEDYISLIKSSNNKILMFFQQNNPNSTEINEIPPNLVEEINRKYIANLNLLIDDKKNISINIYNSFTLYIKFSRDFNYFFQLTVSALDEVSSFVQPVYKREERKFTNLNKKFKIEDKSIHKVMRKISLLMEDRLYFLLRYGKLPSKMGFYLFVVRYFLIFRHGLIIIMTYLKRNVDYVKKLPNLT
jgi:hypothetical protein